MYFFIFYCRNYDTTTVFFGEVHFEVLQVTNISVLGPSQFCAAPTHTLQQVLLISGQPTAYISVIYLKNNSFYIKDHTDHFCKNWWIIKYEAYLRGILWQWCRRPCCVGQVATSPWRVPRCRHHQPWPRLPPWPYTLTTLSSGTKPGLNHFPRGVYMRHYTWRVVKGL